MAGRCKWPVRSNLRTLPRGDKVLTLIHRRLLDRHTMVGVSAGWHAHLAILIDHLNGSEPAAFWTTFEALGREYESRIPTTAVTPPSHR
jgi:hypothetical protein